MHTRTHTHTHTHTVLTRLFSDFFNRVEFFWCGRVNNSLHLSTAVNWQMSRRASHLPQATAADQSPRAEHLQTDGDVLSRSASAEAGHCVGSHCRALISSYRAPSNLIITSTAAAAAIEGCLDFVFSESHQQYAMKSRPNLYLRIVPVCCKSFQRGPKCATRNTSLTTLF